MIVHQHSIIDAIVARSPERTTPTQMRDFLSDLVRALGMQKLFEPIAIHGRFGFTGIVGIVTSHIAFHYFDEDKSLHFDIYSCKSYDLGSVMERIDDFWDVESATVIVLDRLITSIERYSYSARTLQKGDIDRE